ncbi:conserved hypothetical protein [Methanocaldococcus sp. FS406-22]|uniref:hypothetical protein n=1 Tax=Methanocaldococcus sp. (strain FS406-22) TaxID=644281 RepID=UPI0001C4E1B3|nr:hypothetical protein [Methanocaldococcus sp. FS406-22]ADC70140.1 conserved hypothetical protein [Methanocaldococcus sp. FS406-22]
MLKKYLIFLSFILIISIIPVSASSDDFDDKYVIIRPMFDNNWIIIYNNNIYLYNGTLYNITPKKYIISCVNVTYTYEDIVKEYYFQYFLDSFCLGNKTFIICDTWDGRDIGRLDIENRTLYLWRLALGWYYKLKSNNNDEALACFDNKMGMGAKPIILGFRYNKSSNSLEFIGNSRYDLHSKLANYLFNYVNHSKNYYSYHFEMEPFSPISFDYNSKDKYWLIYVEGDLVVTYLEKNGELNDVDNYISCLVKYNGTFYGYKSISFSPYIVYDKYRNQWIFIDDKLYFLDNNLTIVKTIDLDKGVWDVYPIDKNNIYVVYSTKWYDIAGIEKINLNDGRATEIIDLRNITPRYIAYNGKEFLLVGYDLSLYIFDGKTCKKIANLNELSNKTAQNSANKIVNSTINSTNETSSEKSKNKTLNYYLYGIIIIIYIIIGYTLWRRN